MAGVFVSYRRDDSQGFAGRLADDLDERLGRDRVFRDIEIPVGSDFTEVLHRAIAASDVLLVVIGRRWAGRTAAGQPSRLFESTDWVRNEIEAAFARDKQVVPVLVGGAAMPAATELPEGIRRLVKLQAAEVSDRHWVNDVDALADRLRALCPDLDIDHDSRSRPQQESLAEVLRELGERVFDEALSARRPQNRSPASGSSFFQGLMAGVWRGLRRLLGTLLLLFVIYVGIRLFGDESMLNTLDALEARLQIGWDRALQYLQRWRTSGFGALVAGY